MNFNLFILGGTLLTLVSATEASAADNNNAPAAVAVERIAAPASDWVRVNQLCYKKQEPISSNKPAPHLQGRLQKKCAALDGSVYNFGSSDVNEIVVALDLDGQRFNQFWTLLGSGANCVAYNIVKEKFNPRSCTKRKPFVCVMECEDVTTGEAGMKDCRGITAAGSYTLKFDSMGSTVDTQCTSDGWTVILSRGQFGNPADYFDREWDEYAAGFGEPGVEHWLGLDAMFALTSQGSYSLRVKMTAADGTSAVANYVSFAVADASDKYRLKVSGYSGTAGDGLNDTSRSNQHNGMMFTTKDMDNDLPSANCASAFGTGGWWYEWCFSVKLTADNDNGPGVLYRGIIWSLYKGFSYSLESVEMAVKILP